MNMKYHRKVKQHMERIGLYLVRNRNHYVYAGIVNDEKITIIFPKSPPDFSFAINLLNKDIRKEFHRVGAKNPPKLGR